MIYPYTVYAHANPTAHKLVLSLYLLSFIGTGVFTLINDSLIGLGVLTVLLVGLTFFAKSSSLKQCMAD